VICGRSGQTKRMFPSDEFLKGAMFSAVIIGGITLVLLKLWEKKGTTASNKYQKQPTENDERYWLLQ